MPTLLPRPWLLALLLAVPAWAQPGPEPAAPADRASPVAAAPALDSASRADLAPLRALAADMSAAVLAGDADAYLAHVWPGDPVFLAEQRNWAADIAERTPVAFEIELAPPREGDRDHEPPGPEQDAAEQQHVHMTVRWQMTDSAPRRAVAFPARFVRHAADERWMYAGRTWRRIDGPDAAVLFPGDYERAAHRVLQAMPEVIAHVREGFALDPTDAVQQVKIYPDMETLQFSIYPSYVDPLGGWNEPGESIKLLGPQVRSGRPLMALLAHEYGHVATFELGEAMKDVPWWIAEGVAELAAERWSPGGHAADDLIRALARSDSLVPWDQLTDFRTVPAHLHMHVYFQGHHMLGYISERFGRDGRNAWLAALARGLSLDDATHEAFGLPFADLDAAWRSSLQHD